MKSVLNMFVAIAVLLLAIVAVGQSIRLYQEHQSEVHKAAKVAGKYADKAKDVVVDSTKAVVEAAKGE